MLGLLTRFEPHGAETRRAKSRSADVRPPCGRRSAAGRRRRARDGAGRRTQLSVWAASAVLGLCGGLCGPPPAAGGDRLNPEVDPAVLERIENATVLVLVRTDEGVGYGSGFLVGPDLVVTNAHIAPKSATGVYVTSLRLGAPIRATLLASENRGLLRRDLAMLRLDAAPSGVEPLPLARGVGLSGVYAAGFPGLRIQEQIAAFFESGAQLAPRRPTATFGIATSRDDHGEITILSHTAKTARGSSGGPLIDECGRAVGVTSWIRDDHVKNGGYRVNLAQGAEMIRDFLAEYGVETALETRLCAP